MRSPRPSTSPRSHVARGLALAAGLVILTPATADADPNADLTVDAASLRIIKRESGPTNYYAVVTEDDRTFVRARYLPPMKTAVLGYQVADDDRRRVKKVRWSWRAMTLPNGGDECAPGRGDSAAVVYLTWKRGLKYYSLKYVWSAVGHVGRTCDTKRNPFVAQDTIIRQSGGPLGTWLSEEVDLAEQFRRHFEGGDPRAEVPNFVGIGIMSDGDQTRSPSAADYGAFVLVR